MKNTISAVVLFSSLGLFYYSTYGQVVKSQFLPVITKDDEEISSIITQLNQSISENDKFRFMRLFTNPVRAAQLFVAGGSGSIYEKFLPKNVEIDKDEARVVCEPDFATTDKWHVLSLQLKRINFAWKIEISKEFEGSLKKVLPSLKSRKEHQSKKGRHVSAECCYHKPYAKRTCQCSTPVHKRVPNQSPVDSD
jgi:hypothetical protein